jgi:hypothetical protein
VPITVVVGTSPIAKPGIAMAVIKTIRQLAAPVVIGA